MVEYRVIAPNVSATAFIFEDQRQVGQLVTVCLLTMLRLCLSLRVESCGLVSP